MDVIHYQDLKAYIFQEVRIGKATYSPFVLSVFPSDRLKQFYRQNKLVSEQAAKEEELLKMLNGRIGLRFYYVTTYKAFILLDMLKNDWNVWAYDKQGSFDLEGTLTEAKNIKLRAGCLPLNVITFAPASETYEKEELFIPFATKYDLNPPLYLEGKRYHYSNLLNRIAKDKFQCKTK